MCVLFSFYVSYFIAHHKGAFLNTFSIERIVEPPTLVQLVGIYAFSSRTCPRGSPMLRVAYHFEPISEGVGGIVAKVVSYITHRKNGLKTNPKDSMGHARDSCEMITDSKLCP